jgi:hypothetical protein
MQLLVRLPLRGDSSSSTQLLDLEGPCSPARLRLEVSRLLPDGLDFAMSVGGRPVDSLAGPEGSAAPLELTHGTIVVRPLHSSFLPYPHAPFISHNSST